MFTGGEFDAERFVYWQGQFLRSRDFRDQAQMEAELRWWHNRALHQAYGVRSGMRASAINGIDSLIGVKVECGIAYDCYGRALLLQSDREVSLPPGRSPARATLVARYKGGRPGTRSRLECASLEATELVWLDSAVVGVTDGVPLAQLNYESRASLEALPQGIEFGDLAGRIRYDAREKKLVFVGVMSEEERAALRSLSAESVYTAAIEALFEGSSHVPLFVPEFRPPAARALARPRVGSGETVAGDTAWEPWFEPFIFRQRVLPVPIGMQVTVNTEAAGFTEVPCYFAWLAGTLWDRSNVEFTPVPFAHVDRESTTSFRFRLWMPALVTVLGSRIKLANSNFDEEFINYARQHGLHVCWIGIQHGPAEKPCQPLDPLECKTRPED